MTSVRYVRMGPAVFHAVFYDELVANPADPFHNGRLPRDLEAHGLWMYYVLACKNLKAARENIVYENERSLKFDVQGARRLLETIAFTYGTTPSRMVRYWEAVEAQRRALGFNENAELPAVMKFRFN